MRPPAESDTASQADDPDFAELFAGLLQKHPDLLKKLIDKLKSDTSESKSSPGPDADPS
jgi:hypothetical protein